MNRRGSSASSKRRGSTRMNVLSTKRRRSNDPSSQRKTGTLRTRSAVVAAPSHVGGNEHLLETVMKYNGKADEVGGSSAATTAGEDASLTVGEKRSSLLRTRLSHALVGASLDAAAAAAMKSYSVTAREPDLGLTLDQVKLVCFPAPEAKPGGGASAANKQKQREPIDPCTCTEDDFDNWLKAVVVSIPPVTASTSSTRSGMAMSQQARRNYALREATLVAAFENLQLAADLLRRRQHEVYRNEDILTAYYDAVEEDMEAGLKSASPRSLIFHQQMREAKRVRPLQRYHTNASVVQSRLEKLYYALARLEELEGLVAGSSSYVGGDTGSELSDRQLSRKQHRMSTIGTGTTDNFDFDRSGDDSHGNDSNEEEDDKDEDGVTGYGAAQRREHRILRALVKRAKKLETELTLPLPPESITSRMRNEQLLSFSARVLALKEPTTRHCSKSSATAGSPASPSSAPLWHNYGTGARGGDDGQVGPFVEWYVNEVLDPFAMSQLLHTVPMEYMVTTTSRLVYACDANQPLRISKALPDLAHVMLRTVKEGQDGVFSQLTMSPSVSFLSALDNRNSRNTLFYVALLSGDLGVLQRLLSFGFYHTQALFVLLYMQGNWNHPDCLSYLASQIQIIQDMVAARNSAVGGITAVAPRKGADDTGEARTNEGAAFSALPAEHLQEEEPDDELITDAMRALQIFTEFNARLQLYVDGGDAVSVSRASENEAADRNKLTEEALRRQRMLRTQRMQVQQLRVFLRVRDAALRRLDAAIQKRNAALFSLGTEDTTAAIPSMKRVASQKDVSASSPLVFEDGLGPSTFAGLLREGFLDAVTLNRLGSTMTPAFSTPMLRRVDAWSYSPGGPNRNTPVLIRCDTPIEIHTVAHRTHSHTFPADEVSEEVEAEEIRREMLSRQVIYSCGRGGSDTKVPGHGGAGRDDEGGAPLRYSRSAAVLSPHGSGDAYVRNSLYYEAHVSLEYMVLASQSNAALEQEEQNCHGHGDTATATQITRSLCGTASACTAATRNELVIGLCPEKLAKEANGCEGSAGVLHPLGHDDSSYGVSLRMVRHRDHGDGVEEHILQVMKHQNGSCVPLPYSTEPLYAPLTAATSVAATTGGITGVGGADGGSLYLRLVTGLSEDTARPLSILQLPSAASEKPAFCTGSAASGPPSPCPMSSASTEGFSMLSSSVLASRMQGSEGESVDVAKTNFPDVNVLTEADLRLWDESSGEDMLSAVKSIPATSQTFFSPVDDTPTSAEGDPAVVNSRCSSSERSVCSTLSKDATHEKKEERCSVPDTPDLPLYGSHGLVLGFLYHPRQDTLALLVNGCPVGVAFRGVSARGERWYPAATLSTTSGVAAVLAGQPEQRSAVVRFAFEASALLGKHTLQSRVLCRGGAASVKSMRSDVENGGGGGSKIAQTDGPRLLDGDYKFSQLLSVLTTVTAAGVQHESVQKPSAMGSGAASSDAFAASSMHKVSVFRVQQLLNQPSRGGLEDAFFFAPLAIRRCSDDSADRIKSSGIQLIPERARLSPLCAALASRRDATAYTIATHPLTNFHTNTDGARRQRKMALLAACALGYTEVVQVLLERIALPELLDMFSMKIKGDDAALIQLDHQKRSVYSMRQYVHSASDTGSTVSAVASTAALLRAPPYAVNSSSTALDPASVYTTRQSTYTPLHCALLGGNHTRCVTVLLNFLYSTLAFSNKRTAARRRAEDASVSCPQHSTAHPLLHDALNIATRAGETPLLIATRYSNVSVAQRLLRLGANPVCMDRISRATCLEIACTNNCKPIALALLQAPAAYASSPVLLNHAGVATPLCWCALNNLSHLIPLLLQHGANPEIGLDGNSPLLLAASFGNSEAALALLNNCRAAHMPSGGETAMSSTTAIAVAAQLPTININAVDARSQCTPLHIACERGLLQVVHVLLKKRAALDVASRVSHLTPLHTAIVNDHAAIAMRLLEYAKDQLRRGDCVLDVAAINSNGDTALHLAARRGMAPLVEYMMSQFGDEEVERLTAVRKFARAPRSVPYLATNMQGKTPLLLAIQAKEAPTAEVIISLTSSAASTPGGPVIDGTCAAILQAASSGLGEIVLLLLTNSIFQVSDQFRNKYMAAFNEKRERMEGSGPHQRDTSGRSNRDGDGGSAHGWRYRTSIGRSSTSYTDSIQYRTRAESLRAGSVVSIQSSQQQQQPESEQHRYERGSRAHSKGCKSRRSGNHHFTEHGRHSYIRMLLARGKDDASPAHALKLLLRGFALPELYVMLEEVAAESTIVGIQSTSAMLNGEVIIGFLEGFFNVAVAPTRVVQFCRDVVAHVKGVLEYARSQKMPLPHWYDSEAGREEARRRLRRQSPFCAGVMRAIRMYGHVNEGVRALEELEVLVEEYKSREADAADKKRTGVPSAPGGMEGLSIMPPDDEAGDAAGVRASSRRARVGSLFTEEHFCSPFHYTVLQLSASLGLPHIVSYLLDTFPQLSPVYTPPLEKMEAGEEDGERALASGAEVYQPLLDVAGQHERKWRLSPFRLSVRAKAVAVVRVFLDNARARRAESASVTTAVTEGDGSEGIKSNSECVWNSLVDYKEPIAVDPLQRTALQEVIATQLIDAGSAAETTEGDDWAAVNVMVHLMLSHGAAASGRFDASGMDAWLLAVSMEGPAGGAACSLLIGAGVPLMGREDARSLHRRHNHRVSGDALALLAGSGHPLFYNPAHFAEELTRRSGELLPLWRRSGYGLITCVGDPDASASDADDAEDGGAASGEQEEGETAPLTLIERRYIVHLLFACAEHNSDHLIPLLRHHSVLLSPAVRHPVTGDSLITWVLHKARDRLIKLGCAPPLKQQAEEERRLVTFGAPLPAMVKPMAILGNNATFPLERSSSVGGVVPPALSSVAQMAAVTAGSGTLDGVSVAHSAQQHQQVGAGAERDARASWDGDYVYRDPYTIPGVRTLLDVCAQLFTLPGLQSVLYRPNRNGETAVLLAARVGHVALLSLVICPPTVAEAATTAEANITRSDEAIIIDTSAFMLSRTQIAVEPPAALSAASPQGSLAASLTTPQSRDRGGSSLSVSTAAGSSVEDAEVVGSEAPRAASPTFSSSSAYASTATAGRNALLADNLASRAVRMLLATRVYYAEEDAQVVYTILYSIPVYEERVEFLRWAYPNIHPVPALRLASEYASAAKAFLTPTECRNAFWANILFTQYTGRLNELPVPPRTWSTVLRVLLPGAPAVPVYLLKKGALAAERALVPGPTSCSTGASPPRPPTGMLPSRVGFSPAAPGDTGTSSSPQRKPRVGKYKSVSNWTHITRRTSIFLQLMALAVADSLMPPPTTTARGSVIKRKQSRGSSVEGRGKKKVQAIAESPPPTGLQNTLLGDVVDLAARFDDVDVLFNAIELRLPEHLGASLQAHHSHEHYQPSQQSSRPGRQSNNSAVAEMLTGSTAAAVLASSPSLAAALTPAQLTTILARMQNLLWKELVEVKRIDLLAVASGSIRTLRRLYHETPLAAPFLSTVRYDRIDANNGLPEGVTIPKQSAEPTQPQDVAQLILVEDFASPRAGGGGRQHAGAQTGPFSAAFAPTGPAHSAALSRGSITSVSNEDDTGQLGTITVDEDDIMFVRSCTHRATILGATAERLETAKVTWGVGAAAKAVEITQPMRSTVVRFVDGAKTPISQGKKGDVVAMESPHQTLVAVAAPATHHQHSPSSSSVGESREGNWQRKRSLSITVSGTSDQLSVLPPRWFMYLQGDWAMHSALVLHSPQPSMTAIDVLLFLMDRRAPLNVSAIQMFLAASVPPNRWRTSSGEVLTLGYQTHAHGDTLLHLLVINDQCQVAEYLLAASLAYFARLRYDEPNLNPGRFLVRERHAADCAAADAGGGEAGEDQERYLPDLPSTFQRYAVRRNHHGLTAFDYARSAGMIQVLQYYGCVPPTYRPNPQTFSRALYLRAPPAGDRGANVIPGQPPRKTGAASSASFFTVPRLLLVSENFLRLQDGDNGGEVNKEAGLPNSQVMKQCYQKALLTRYQAASTSAVTAPAVASVKESGGSASRRAGHAAKAQKAVPPPLPGMPNISDTLLLRQLLTAQRSTGNSVLPVLLDEDVSLLHLGLCSFDDELVQRYGNRRTTMNGAKSQLAVCTQSPTAIQQANATPPDTAATYSKYTLQLLPPIVRQQHQMEPPDTASPQIKQKKSNRRSRGSVGLRPTSSGASMDTTSGSDDSHDVSATPSRRTTPGKGRALPTSVGGKRASSHAASERAVVPVTQRDVIQMLARRQFVVFPLALPAPLPALAQAVGGWGSRGSRKSTLGTKAAAKRNVSSGGTERSVRGKGGGGAGQPQGRATDAALFHKAMAAHNVDAEEVVDECPNEHEGAVLVSLTTMQLAIGSGAVKAALNSQDLTSSQYMSAAAAKPAFSTAAAGAHVADPAALTQEVTSMPVMQPAAFTMEATCTTASVGLPATMAAQLDEWAAQQSRGKSARGRTSAAGLMGQSGNHRKSSAEKPRKRLGSVQSTKATSWEAEKGQRPLATPELRPSSSASMTAPVGGVSTVEQQALMRVLLRQFASSTGAKLSHDLGFVVGPTYDVDTTGDSVAAVRQMKATSNKFANVL